MPWGTWLKQAVLKLVRFGYRHSEVGDMPLNLFAERLSTVEQLVAEERSAFVMDMAVVVSSVFAKKGSNPVKGHLEVLDGVIRGKKSGNQQKRA